MRITGAETWLSQQGLHAVKVTPLSGGCVASACKVELNNGDSVVVKRYAQSAAAILAAEAEGLACLAQSGLVRTPKVFHISAEALVLEFINAAPRSASSDQVLGRQLAALHQLEAPAFGFPINTFCGATEQPNPVRENGFQFYAEARYLYLARRCLDQGLLGRQELKQVEAICNKLEALIPAQKPALLHGDLWSGNVIDDEHGAPVLLDPAVYWGWPEADLAMTRLFGGFGEGFYSAYIEARPLAPGWVERVELYNLWHLLNHLLLFGSSYKPDVRRILARYT